MEKQSLKNHIRFYPPHHFIFYPVLSILVAFSIYFTFVSEEKLLWIFISLLFVAVITLSFMMRQHYALTLQDRIIRLEMRYRYYATTGKRFEDLEHAFDDSQIFALRFCPDSQLETLVHKTFSEKLSAAQIKQSITSWQPDDHRV